ncbi:MAG: hypothetical protein J5645_09925 [Lachnospiraceae bacterium]|nr:hypothetical protein [Lachnospiraceae bacterium]
MSHLENGEWIMRGVAWNDPRRIRSIEELEQRIEEVGFLPLFRNEVEGFSVEEQTAERYWWTGIRSEDPWEWREIIARERRIAYGKFFDGKAGFISLAWLPYFVNYRRDGYDFDARWQDGLASRREKRIMDFYLGEDESGETVYREERILSTELKKKAGFGKGGEKNFPGILTGLQMQLYLVITDFRRRVNKRGEAYGMAVSIPLPPETVWGYETVTSAYNEDPASSRERIAAHIRKLYPAASEKDIDRLVGK